MSKLTSASTSIRVARDYMKMSKIKKVEMSRVVFEHALEIMEITPLKHPKDAINVASMLELGIQKIISEDKDYDKTELIQRVHPKDL